MSYFAAAVVRGSKGWSATELDLSGAADVEEVADLLRDVHPDAAVSLLFVESDDVYLVIMRLDQGEDLRVFGSDSVFAEESRLGALLLGDIEIPALEIETLEIEDPDDLTAPPAGGDDVVEEEPPAAEPDVDPVGDADLLADLGVSAHRLLALCAHEGMLPADVIAEVCQAIGCGDEVEELRDA
ncbi:MAG TPA: tRNA adenosine deaminase-associated protein [Micromonosporaceae bacterium]|nr:tRNA adenosine deaminase-associated protein [Micromonosporaceae bacterium]